jgi:hypothetical protein
MKHCSVCLDRIDSGVNETCGNPACLESIRPKACNKLDLLQHIDACWAQSRYSSELAVLRVKVFEGYDCVPQDLAKRVYSEIDRLLSV